MRIARSLSSTEAIETWGAVELRYLGRLITAHFRFIAIAAIVAAVGALAATYLLPEKYKSSTTILIRPQRRVEFTPAQQSMLGFPPSVTGSPETISQTYATMMTSNAVATRVVRALALDVAPPEPAGPWYRRGYRWVRNTARDAMHNAWDFVRFGRVKTPDPFAAAVERVQRQLDAVPVKGTYLFSLTATWDDPQLAARIANTAAEEFTRYAEDARRAEGNASLPFFTSQLDTLRGTLQAARDRLAAFRTQHDVSSLEQQVTVTLKTLAELEASHEEAVHQSAEAQAALTEVDQLLAKESPELHTSGTTVTNPVVESLKEQLLKDQVKLAALQETQTAEHPDVRALTASIEEARQRIAAESARINASDTSEINPFYKSLKQQRLDRSVAARSLAARESALKTSIDRYRVQVASLTGLRGELSKLELDADVLENEYRLLSGKSEEARLSAAQEIADLRALAPAVPPLYPSSPIRVVYAAAGFMLGLIGALFVLFATDYANPRIRTVEEVARLLGVPTLAQVPGMDHSRAVVRLLGDSAGDQGTIARMAARNSTRRVAS
jgi:uncharacterized protein involved in exopolysaccharide biosynthesis